MKSGNVIHLTYTDTATNTQRSISIVRVDDPSVFAVAEYHDHRPERHGGRDRFFRAPPARWQRSSTPH